MTHQEPSMTYEQLCQAGANAYNDNYKLIGHLTDNGFEVISSTSNTILVRMKNSQYILDATMPVVRGFIRMYANPDFY